MTTVADLKADIGEWMNRSDLGAKLDVFIRMAEGFVDRELRHPRMLSLQTLVHVDESGCASLPAGTMQVLSVFSEAEMLKYLSPTDFKRAQQEQTGEPLCGYTLRGSELCTFSKAPLTFVAYARLPSLTDEPASSNWLLEEAYDVYLHLCLAFAQAYVQDMEQADWHLERGRRAVEALSEAGLLAETAARLMYPESQQPRP